MSHCEPLASSLSVRSGHQLVPAVYVDDFKMQKRLGLLRKNFNIEPETGLVFFWGCNQSRVCGSRQRAQSYYGDLEQFLRSVLAVTEVAVKVKGGPFF